MNKIFLIAVGFSLLGTAGYVASKRSKDPFTVALDCKTGSVSWTGAPSNTGSIALFGISKTRMSTQVVANIPATRNMITADDALQTFVSIDRTANSNNKCLPMFSYDGVKYCPGDLEITAFAIQDPILVARRRYNPTEIISPTDIRDLAASKALDSTSIIVKCPGIYEKK